jgi:hypothetical protein
MFRSAIETLAERSSSAGVLIAAEAMMGTLQDRQTSVASQYLRPFELFMMLLLSLNYELNCRSAAKCSL